MVATSSWGSLWFPSSSVQLRRMKFLKKRAPASRVVWGRVSVATICSRAREKAGLTSSALSDCSAVVRYGQRW